MTVGPSKVIVSFVITREQQERLKAVKDRDGVPESEQVRRALDAWFGSSGDRRGKPRRRRS